MSYALALPLQAALYQHLLADAGVAALVGADVYDALPSGDWPETFVSIGAEEVRDASDRTNAGAEHRIVISVIGSQAGYAPVKTVAGAVCDALDGAALTLTRGRLVGLWFDRAVARRDGKAQARRRVDLRFRARVEDN